MTKTKHSMTRHLWKWSTGLSRWLWLESMNKTTPTGRSCNTSASTRPLSVSIHQVQKPKPSSSQPGSSWSNAMCTNSCFHPVIEKKTSNSLVWIFSPFFWAFQSWPRPRHQAFLGRSPKTWKLPEDLSDGRCSSLPAASREAGRQRSVTAAKALMARTYSPWGERRWTVVLQGMSVGSLANQTKACYFMCFCSIYIYIYMKEKNIREKMQTLTIDVTHLHRVSGIGLRHLKQIPPATHAVEETGGV